MYRVEHLYEDVRQSTKIEWNIGKRCNYDCSYCPAEIHDNFSEHTDIEILKNTVDVISKMNKPRISFTGGEPCVHPPLPLALHRQRDPDAGRDDPRPGDPGAAG